MFISISYATEKISFLNLNTSVELLKQNESYFVESSNLIVNISNRLIIKTETHLQLAEQIYIKNIVTRVWQAYQGESFNYYVAELKDGISIDSEIKQLSQINGILLVQPDILQHRVKTEASKQHYLPNKQTLFDQVYFEHLDKLDGKNINIGIIDDGFDLTDADFKQTQIVFEYDVQNQSLSARPKNKLDYHGTKVAKIIFGKNNSFNGLAPLANFIAIRQPTTWTSNTLLAFQVAKLNRADIINCSWHSRMLLEPIKDVVDDLAVNGRSGKGTAVVFSAGNQGVKITKNIYEASINLAKVGRFSGTLMAAARLSGLFAAVAVIE
ncbi:S8 family serine peptidase [Catenovulum sp. 2E275]|uniref:S8 family peptidase n=1 Tax=Catenovulum sp. 2E275 TaxID=2980497 RepID=UPI0021CEA226|nr:S8 family serine peptidase [Catenovulum sp. 2E275]MCU4676764.1 S8 family serine peptidase [Catenovulum sp. 2E275]